MSFVYTVYHEPEPNGVNVYKRDFKSMWSAMNHAAELSRTANGYVGVMRNGIERATFLRGKHVEAEQKCGANVCCDDPTCKEQR